jgi:uncharacterized damage-inducible protein DinB
MNAHSAIKAALATAEMIGLAYLEDLSDNEMMVRPVEGCNHIKWQLGHLIVSENKMINAAVPGALPDLPLGFAQRYASDKSNDDAAISFDSKDELLQLYRQQRAATLRTLDGLTEQQLDAETHESIRSYAPTVGTAFVMQDSHWMMHAGQWAVVRRKLGRKPIF